jgi:carbon-monoxide dehydrogenase large subunit
VTLEPRGCVAQFDVASGRLTVHASSQNPAGFQGTIAQLLALPPEKVRVVVGDVGGGFGMKALVHPEDIVCAHAARKSPAGTLALDPPRGIPGVEPRP